ncbi:protein kinase domain-containing protein [Ornithinimicrobium sp. W1679]|uniref:serine/threonine-protein kinase n=1 Tax=Ornithinimicrobium sp. W1679 TaxID=3418770 RepID=UPI003CFB23AE
MTTELPRTPGAYPTRRVPVVVPRRLGRYELLERIGEGGMGVVWRAVDDRGRQVAVKVLREHIAHDEQARARLRREVHSLARVHHPRVAAVVDADVDGPAPYIVTEHVAGRPLDEVVQQEGPLNREELLRLGRGLGEALDAIHRAGIVHRDLKPGNVLMVPGSGRGHGADRLDPVVIDFGIAQVADDVRLTMTGMVMGTPGYLSPEVVEGGDVGRATDWWGWAATLAFAASGEPPFGRAPMTVVLDRVTRGRLRIDGVDPELRPLLAAALDPDPGRRPTQQQVLDGLERYARGEDVTGALPRGATVVGVAGTHGPADAPDVDVTRRQPVVDPTRGTPQHHPRVQAVPPPPWEAPHADPAGRGGAAPTAYPSHDPEPGRGGPVAPSSPDPGQDPYAVPPGEQGGPDPRIGRSPRTGTLAALLVAFVGLASAVPLLAWSLFALWGVAARTVDASLTTLVLRRHEAGRRRSDVPVLVAASPWHLTRGVLATAFSLLLPLGMAALVALVVSGVVTTTETMIGVDVEHPVPVATGSIVGALLAWWGLSATPLRRGSRTILRGGVPAGLPTVGLVTVTLVGGVALAVWGFLDAPAVSWWPLPPDLDLRDVLPIQLP